MLSKQNVKSSLYKDMLISLLLIISLSLFMQDSCFAQRNTINVLVSKCEGDVNYKLFGTNLLLYKSKWPPHNQYSDYGAGIWDAAEKKHNLEVIDLANDCNIAFVRYMSGNEQHDWKKGVGRRSDYLYGLDEYMQTCEMFNAEANIVVNYFAASSKDSADLVTYLNVKADDALIKILRGIPFLSGEQYNELFEKYVKRKDGIDWSNYRAINGRIQPYNVKYFEIGNEVYYSKFGVSPEFYAEKFIGYYKAMKRIDNDINIGVLFHLDNNKWNKKIMNLIQERMDFGVVHIYPSAYKKKVLEPDYLKKQFYLLEHEISNKVKLLFKEIKDIPIAVTEFNGGYFQWKDRKLRWSLGNSLLNAEIFKMLMQKNMNIIFANNWNLINEGWGMIANGFQGDPQDVYNYYYERPNYYIFKMYADYFGDVLINTDVQCEGYGLVDYADHWEKRYFDNLKGRVVGEDLLKDQQWKINDVKGVEAKLEEVLKIEFKDPRQFNYYHISKSSEVAPENYYKVSGYVKAEGFEVNEAESGFRLEVQDKRGWNATKWAKATEDVRGTTDWIYVEKIFKTLSDAKEIRIIARRSGENPPLKGKIFIKNVNLRKFIPDNCIISYLSVNASKSEDGKTVYLMVVNKNLDEDEETEIVLNGFKPSGVARVYTLWGKTIDATNEKRPHNDVRIYEDKVKFTGNKFKYKFKKHSLTAVVVESLEAGVGR